MQNVCIASAGPALAWKIYSGTKNTTKQVKPCLFSCSSIFFFRQSRYGYLVCSSCPHGNVTDLEKRQIEKWPKAEREAFPDLLKRGVNQLTRLRHPRILTIERSLEESRDSFAFCTEPVGVESREFI